MHSAITIQAPEVSGERPNRLSIKNTHIVLFLLVMVVSLGLFVQNSHERQAQLQQRLRETLTETEVLKAKNVELEAQIGHFLDKISRINELYDVSLEKKTAEFEALGRSIRLVEKKALEYKTLYEYADARRNELEYELSACQSVNPGSRGSKPILFQ